jgi:hypothetical protein
MRMAVAGQEPSPAACRHSASSRSDDIAKAAGNQLGPAQDERAHENLASSASVCTSASSCSRSSSMTHPARWRAGVPAPPRPVIMLPRRRTAPPGG